MRESIAKTSQASVAGDWVYPRPKTPFTWSVCTGKRRETLWGSIFGREGTGYRRWGSRQKSNFHGRKMTCSCWTICFYPWQRTVHGRSKGAGGYGVSKLNAGGLTKLSETK